MSVTAERLMVEVQADVRQALRGLEQVERKSAATSGRMSKMARSMGLTFGGAAILGGIKKTINLAMDFDTTMRQIGVQTDQAGKQLQGLSKLALQMGKDTVFSAQDAAGAMLELSKGGLTAAQIKAGALQQTLTLAAAGGLELSSAAGYITQGMNTFGLSADKAVRITTALAGGANASTASVESMGMALSQVGAGAVNAGMNIQETVAALAAFDNAGIKGSDAGTSLKTMLSSLVASTQKANTAMNIYGLDFVKRNGDFKSMAQVAGELRKGLGSLGQAERVRAMKTIFGSDATRAATVLMKEGAKGVREYMKATTDTAKAQDMANVAMEGAKGAWENFTGSVETAAIQVGTKLLPAFTDAANAGSDFISEVMTWGPQIEETFGWTVGPVKLLGDALQGVGSIVKSAAQFFAALPGPVKEMGAQALVAALVLPKLSFALTTVSTNLRFAGAAAISYAGSLTTAAGRSAALTATTARMGGMMRGAAGVGGMVALMQGAEKAGTSMGMLANVAGGALLGFSLGGPIGGAIGAGAGALLGLKQQTDASAAAMEAAKPKAMDYASTLDQLTGAATRSTRAMVSKRLQERGVMGSAKALGVQTRDLVGAVMGEEGAMRRVNVATREAEAGLRKLGREGKLTDGMYRRTVGAIGQVRGITQGMSSDLRRQVRETREAGRATITWKEALKGVPPKVRTKLEQAGYQQSFGQLRRLVDTYKMTPKQVRTTVAALGVDLTRSQMRALIKESKVLGDQKPRVRPDVEDGPPRGKMNALMGIANALGLKRPRVVVSADTGGAMAALNGIQNYQFRTKYITVHTRNTGGIPVGSADGGTVPKTGLGYADRHPYLLADGEEVISNRNGQADRWRPFLKAINANRLADGGTAGKKPKIPPIWGKDTVKSLVGEIRDGMKPTHKVFNQLQRVIERNMKGDRERSWLKELGQREKRITRVWERHARITARLAAAQEKVADLREAKSAFVDATRSGMASQATVLNAGNNAATIASSLSAQVEKVQRFAGMLGQLRKMGYSDAIVRQVAEAGVEGGWQAATALVAATKEQRTAITASFDAITQTAGNTAKDLGAAMYDSGIRAAQGMVKGLKDRRKEVEDTIRQMAMAMQKALKHALGIKSPSRVFARLGSFTAQGMVKGLEGEQRNVAKAAANLGVAATYATSKGLTPGALNGGVRAGAPVSFTFITHNPQAEPASVTTNKAMAKVATLGLV